MSDDPHDADYGAEAAPEFEHLDYAVEDGVARITFARPAALNALHDESLLELATALQLAEADVDVQALILTGEGRAFVAGADIGALAELEDAFGGREFALSGQDVLNNLAALPFPTIAAINGYAIGGGLEVALACDLRVAAREAAMGLSEVRLGLIPGYGGTQRLPRLVGQGRALDLILTGRLVDAEEALSLGLVNRVAENAVEAATELARATMRNGPVALGLAKEAVARGADVTLPQGMEIEADLFGLATATQDATEGTQAFLDKRDPEFEGR